VERLRPRISQLAQELVDALPSGQPVDLLPAFATPIPLTVICELLGVPVERGNDLLTWSHAMCEMYVPQRSRETEERANRASAEFGAFLTAHIEEHRHNGADDLLSALIAVRDTGEKLSDDELISTCVLLLNAGHEATVHQTGNAVKAILEQGGDPRRFFETPERAAATIEEALRYDAPLHMFTRYAYEEIDLGPVVLKPGEQVALLLGAANRDPSAFDSPHTFRPDRSGPEKCQLRRRPAFLHRRTSRPARIAAIACRAVRAAAGPYVADDAALPKQLSFPRARNIGRDMTPFRRP
jgi:cytochrome P450